MSPRRSSRARTSQPSPAIQHTNSSSSSHSMTRERSTRSNHKNPSPRSQSDDDADKGDFRETRQRQRARGDDENDLHAQIGDGEDDDVDEEDEEEITRCLCGQQEYPGLPLSRREALGRNGARGGIKDENSMNFSAGSSDLMSDDIGSMFIQCDSCKVWQHGGCVGIMDEAMSPDEYFCEECRKDLHRIRSETNGSHSSQYLPVVPIPSTTVSSRDSSRDTAKRVKDPKSRQSDPFPNPKRRSTMNSRDAAYDEEEQLRRAIEESKEDNKTTDEEESTTRRPKRSRSDSEAHRQAPKRQRTSSPSPGITAKQSNPASPVASDDEAKSRATTNGNRKQRATSRGQREKDAKELDEPETEQADAAGRRKGRSDRRKGEGVDSDHEIVESPIKATAIEPELPQPSPDASVPAPESAPPRPSTRKSGRPPARRGRVGRNQYTRDRDLNGTGTDSNTGNSPRRGQSLEMSADSPRIGTLNMSVNGTETGKPSRPRYVHQRATMNEMKRRVAAILEFISRMQIEMAAAGESITPPERTNGIDPHAIGEQLESILSRNAEEGSSDNVPIPTEKDFKDLSSLEMMDVLTRHLLKWQQEYGKFGER
ncbi:putative transcriptional regulator (Cti6) [Aspergillus undulatus]|uniref:putative transcriptional regulator (Cti6) n=1 Tax=Aspergillus undulatus TaxID=1810928 RepID=UPI003CCCABEC